MSQPFVGEIRMFGGNFAPAGWSLCSGQLMAISENETLFNLIGTTYGGDGQSTFALPNLQGRLPIHSGTGAGLSARQLGESLGTEAVAVTTNQVPTHTHNFVGTNAQATDRGQAGRVPAIARGQHYVKEGTLGAMHAASISQVGGNQPHNNLQPYLCVNFIISLYGIFPSQN